MTGCQSNKSTSQNSCDETRYDESEHAFEY
jgi:hypothetical protein